MRGARAHLRLEVFHLIAKLHDDSLILSDVGGDGEHITRHLRLQVLGAVRVLERVDGLFELPVRRGDIGNHHRAAVAAERVFEKARHLGIAEGDVCVALLVGESVDAVPQREQRAVDVGAFLEPCTRVVSLGGTLRSREVDE